LFDKFLKKWSPTGDKGRCSSDEVLPLGLAETYPIFSILGVVMIVSVVVAFAEKFYHKFKNRKFGRKTRVHRFNQ